MKGVIEQTWLAYRELLVGEDSTSEQTEAIRQAYFAGACVVFKGLLSSLSPGDEPSDADLAFMALLDRELAAFGAELDRKNPAAAAICAARMPGEKH